MSHDAPLDYRRAGVDIAGADAFVQRIGAMVQATHGPEVLPGTGAYAGLYRLPLGGASGPVLAAACDGVGTKLVVAQAMQMYRGLGQDLVAMNVNDLLPSGARPLFFLDYIACGSLQPEAMASMVQGMADACHQAGCALLGGETAEMPDVYDKGSFDLAGFAVGLIDKQATPQPVAVGDVALALPATGVHANGLTLVRRALARAGLALSARPSALAASLGETLLVPTPIYVQPVLQLLQHVTPKAAAHITGGGLQGRGRKLLRPGQDLVLQRASYPVPPIFAVIADAGAVSPQQMHCTFNMGLGYVMLLDAAQAAQTRAKWQALGFLQVGQVVAGAGEVRLA